MLGASGSVGGALVRHLATRPEVEVLAASRDEHAALPPGVKRVLVDLADPRTLEHVLQGVDAVHLIWPFFESGADTRRRIAPIARLLGERARRVVYVSALAAADDPQSFWHVVEDAISDHVAEWTILRPTGFAANARQWAGQIRDGDVVRWPLGDLARPLIHESDIAAVAAAALTRDGHHGQRYVITGPSLITQRDQVSAIGSAIGRPLRWDEISVEQARDELGVPGSMLDAWDAMRHTPEPVNDVVERLTGRAPLTFEDWARAHATDFMTAQREAV